MGAGEAKGRHEHFRIIEFDVSSYVSDVEDEAPTRFKETENYVRIRADRIVKSPGHHREDHVKCFAWERGERGTRRGERVHVLPLGTVPHKRIGGALQRTVKVERTRVIVIFKDSVVGVCAWFIDLCRTIDERDACIKIILFEHQDVVEAKPTANIHEIWRYTI